MSFLVEIVASVFTDIVVAVIEDSVERQAVWMLAPRPEGLVYPEGKEIIPHEHKWRIDGQRSKTDRNGRPYCTECNCQPCWYELVKVTDEKERQQRLERLWMIVERDPPKRASRTTATGVQKA